MPNFATLKAPTTGTAITRKGGRLVVPNDPIIPYIEGDGTGPDIWRASVRIFDAAVSKAFGNSRRIAWFEVPAGEKAKEQIGEWLPNDTLEAVKAYKVAIKGPLTTPVGGGIRSLNVTLRQVLDLYACVRPVRYFEGTPAPVPPSRADERGDLPREHRGRVRRHRVGPRNAAGRTRHRIPVDGDGQAHPSRFRHRHQADLRDRDEAAGPHGDPVRHRQQTEDRDDRPQGQHHEVHGRGVQ